MLGKLRFARRFASFEYDLAVVGGGPGGYVAAIKAAQLGFKTACIEKRGTLGGTCLNVGCIPAKALLNSSHKFVEAQHEFKNHGVICENVRADIPQMMKSKKKAVDGLTKGVEGLFKKNKVTYVKGAAAFSGKNELTVNGTDKLTAKNIIIATGSEPAALPGGILPIDEKNVLSSTGAMELQEAPKKLVVVGAGVIGLELGSVWSRLGSEVTIVEFMDKIGSGTDLEMGKTLKKILEKQGLKFHLKTKVTGGEVGADSVKVNLEGENVPATMEADKVLIGVGRKAHTEGLNLEAVGLKVDKAGKIPVNENLQTQQSHIYAIGDCVAGPMLAHKAEEDGIFVVESLAGETSHISYETVPWVIYTHPEIAWVGKTEEQLKEANINYKKGSFPFLANSRARANHETDGLVKVLTDSKTDRILGMHMVGPAAGEIIMEGVLGMEYGASSEDLARTCHAHPGFSEAIKEACLAAHSSPIHI